jgi:hypothetical protein
MPRRLRRIQRSRYSEAASMAVIQHFVTPFSRLCAAARAGCAACRPSRSATLALLLAGALAMPGIAAAQTSPGVSGAWQLSCPGRMGHVRRLTLQIEQSGPKLSGRFSARHRSGKLSGAVRGDQISLRMDADGRSIALTGTTDGGSMSLHGPKGRPCTASRR